MKTKIKFKDGIEIEEYTKDNFYDIVGSLGIDLDDIPELKASLSTEQFVKNVCNYGKADSVIDGMCSVQGRSVVYNNCEWIVSVGPVSSVKYEDVINSGYKFSYFTLSDKKTVYVLFTDMCGVEPDYEF